MTENEVTVADRLTRVRVWLNSQGEIGAWLLAAIDDAIDMAVEYDTSIVEDESTEQDDSKDEDLDMFGVPARRHRRGQRRPQPSRPRKTTGIAFRPPTDPAESLRLHLQVLQAYLVVLPRCVESTRAALQHDFGVQQATFVLPGEVTSGALGRAQASFPISEVIRPAEIEKAAQLISAALDALNRP